MFGFGNKINEKDKKIIIDNNDLLYLYDLLTQKNKDENFKRASDIEYQKIFQNLEELFFKKEGTDKPENVESSKTKLDCTKNRILENESATLLIKDNTSIELIFKIIRLEEKTNFINNYDNDYDNYLDEDEEPVIVKAFITEIQKLEKILNGDKKSERIIAKRKIQLYLFIIYMILKNYPFFIPKRTYLEKYFLKLKKYKDYPDQIGSQGKNLYSLFIDELYLPGITIFKEIRKKYFLDSVDPNKFILVSDDFLRYYFLFDEGINSSKYKFLKDESSNGNVNIIAKELFTPATNIFNEEVIKNKTDIKSINGFNYLSIMHLIIFFCQEVLSHDEKVKLNIYERLCGHYLKKVPDFKNKEAYNDLIGIKNIDLKKDGIKENINKIYEKKNSSRNTLNKSLLNSFFNILDMGLKTDYYKDFLPMIKEIEKKIMASISGQEGQKSLEFLNLRKFLVPKIEIKTHHDISFVNLYQYNFINIEDKYLSHLNKTIDYKNYDIDPEDKKRVDQFNCIVRIKKNILEKYLKMKFILYEEQLISFIEKLFKNIEILKDKLIEKEIREKNLLKEKELKEKEEKEEKEKKLKQESEKKGNKKKKDDPLLEEEKKKKTEQEILKNMSYYELKKLPENNPYYSFAKELIENKEANALPDVESFINSIILYVLPNDNLEQNLSDFICRNDFIYKYLFTEKNGIDNNNTNKLLKENLCIYLEETKNYFELDIYQALLIPKRQEEEIMIKYFYSYIIVEVLPRSEPLSISYLNNNESPEDEKIVNQFLNIRKIYIMNIMFKEKKEDEKLPGAKYILNENSGKLTVFCMTNTLNDINNNNTNYYMKLLAHQTNSEIFNCDEIKITGNLKITGGIKNLEENFTIEELIVGHATYDLGTKEKRAKLKIATFSDFNII